MNSRAAAADPANDYVFRFDAPLEPVIFGGAANLHGWLLHRDGNPINGLRAVMQGPFFRKEILAARRKRKRPDVSAAFPHLADAEASGFLFELRLRFGRNQIKFQVLDHERTWRTFSSASVVAVPLTLLTRTGFSNVQRFLILYLRQLFAAARSGHETFPSPDQVVAFSAATTSRVDLFATSKSNLFIVEIGELVAAGFRELGCESTLHLDVMPDENPPEGTMQIVVTPHEYYNLFLTEKVSRQRARQLTQNVHLLCTEQPETGWFASNLQWGVHSLGVVDINPLGVAAYRARGLPAHQLQLGYHSILAHPNAPPHPERRLDLTFLGSMTSRREEFFAEHANFFARHQCHLRFVPLGFAKTKATRSYLSTEHRNELLSDSRILLNLHYSELKYFEWHRMLVGLANGCCIISETCKGYGTLVPGRHFIMVEPESLIPACEYYLAHPEECENVGHAGREFIETELRQAQTCRAFLQEIENKGQAPGLLPLDAPAVPLTQELRQAIAAQTRRLLVQALNQDLRNLLGKGTKTEKPRPSSATSTASEQQQQRAAVVRQRAAYRTRLAQQEEERARGKQVVHLHENRASTKCESPKLSVLITLYNYAHHIDECIDSIARAAEQLAEAPEIVIVNDASSDNSLTRALHRLRESELPIRVVNKQFNTGLADARNTALRFSRAPYVFMMDADNLIYPGGLRQLLDVIGSGDYAAAYSLLCRFRGTPTNRVGLLSYFDFDPQILVQYPYIDAMAMFRRQTLLELGGYDNELSQIGWFGWEDYDMWLKYAQADLPVGFIPNTLCLYRHHETSMINTTNLFESDLVHHFMNRYGDLLDRFETRATVFGVDRKKTGAFREAKQLPIDDELPRWKQASSVRR
ncbi:MAG: glycosyltransferase [Chthoniobacterales bacterium]|nr:glycosyltransferase [Chthoniobacterales bacterium]